MLNFARETQIKIARRYHLTLLRIGIIKKSINNKGVEKRESSYIVTGNETSCSHNEKQYEDFKNKTKIGLPYDPTIPFLNTYLENMKSLVEKT